MSHKKSLSISIVIPALNEEHYLAKCLETIMQYKTDDLKEIIVVDNGSKDKTVEVASRYPGVKVLRFSHPLGLPKAREPGFKAATGDLIASLDADVMIPEEWFAQIQEIFRAQPGLSCLSGPYRYFDFPFGEYVLHRIVNTVLTYPWHIHSRLNGGNFVIRREVLSKVDLFDTDVKFWGEDTIIGQKVRTVGTTLFHMRFFVFTSARRWKQEGFWKIGWRYFENLIMGKNFRHPLRHKQAEVVR